MRQVTALCCGILALVAVVVAGCSAPAVEDAPTERSAESTSAATADVYRLRAEMLAQALDRVTVSTISNAPTDLVTSVLESPEEGPVRSESGLVTCRIVSLETTPAAVVVNRIQVFMGSSADEQAARDGATPPPDGVYVRDLVAEEVRVPLADDFIFVGYAQAVPEGIPVISPEGRFPIVVLNREEFIAQYPLWLGQLLAGNGLVLTFDEGAAVFGQGNYTS
ncbi:MAG: hypothetical protein LLG08_05570 [Actinomycetia bacterium]|nr:hypothetical protein [Actinomycetes bacterium]